MKKNAKRSLKLNRETIRSLDLAEVHGGEPRHTDETCASNCVCPTDYCVPILSIDRDC